MSKNLLINTNINMQDNYRKYYQEYEGTFITVTDKSEDDIIDTDRFIEITEIWGNTVQDENNLEDIQSVGELYVDEKGEPILDELGREQYKIEIESCNKNLASANFKIGGLNIVNGDIDNTSKDRIVSETYIKTKPGQILYISSEETSGIRVCSYDINKKFVKFNQANTVKETTHTVADNVYFIRICFLNTTNINQNIQVEVNSVATNHTSHQSHKATILLPCQLMKVGDVYDRLYWDNEKGKYVVEKNVNKAVLDDTLSWTTSTTAYGTFLDNVGNTITGWAGTNRFISSYLKSINMITDANSNVCGLWRNKAVFSCFSIHPTLNDFKLYIKENPIHYIYIVDTPQLIETNITEKIQLPCYEETTHIFCNSTVDATMKVLVPYKEKQLTPVMDGLICWLDGRDGIVNGVWKDRSGNGNDIELNLLGGYFTNYSVIFSENDVSSIIDNMFMYNSDITIEINTGNMPMKKSNNILCKINSSINDFIIDFRYGSKWGLAVLDSVFCIPLRNPVSLTWLPVTPAPVTFNTSKQSAVFTKNGKNCNLFFDSNNINSIDVNVIVPDKNTFTLLTEFQGEVYSILIYNRALTEEEIQQNYKYEQSIQRGE